MKWKPITECKGTLKKKKDYEFQEITADHVKQAEKYTYEEPLFIKGKLGTYELYKNKDKIKLIRNLSYTEFELIGGI